MRAIEKFGLPFQIFQAYVRDLKSELPFHTCKDAEL